MKLNSILARAAEVLFKWPWRLLKVRMGCVGLCLGLTLYVMVIAGPNIRLWLKVGHGNPAVSEINGIELALTKILSDAGRSDLQDLFDPVAFEKTCAWYELQYDTDAF